MKKACYYDLRNSWHIFYITSSAGLACKAPLWETIQSFIIRNIWIMVQINNLIIHLCCMYIWMRKKWGLACSYLPWITRRPINTPNNSPKLQATEQKESQAFFWYGSGTQYITDKRRQNSVSMLQPVVEGRIPNWFLNDASQECCRLHTVTR